MSSVSPHGLLQSLETAAQFWTNPATRFQDSARRFHCLQRILLRELRQPTVVAGLPERNQAVEVFSQFHRPFAGLDQILMHSRTQGCMPGEALAAQGKDRGYGVKCGIVGAGSRGFRISGGH